MVYTREVVWGYTKDYDTIQECIEDEDNFLKETNSDELSGDLEVNRILDDSGYEYVPSEEDESCKRIL